MKMTINPPCELEIAKLEHHNWLLDLDNWPEIINVYDVHASICEEE